ncbi:hypothetical protein G9A89_000556, partial [Geosiphon pyriformis]
TPQFEGHPTAGTLVRGMIVFQSHMRTTMTKKNGSSFPHPMYVVKDWISEWPAIFNEGDWQEKDDSVGNKRKQKARKRARNVHLTIVGLLGTYQGNGKKYRSDEIYHKTVSVQVDKNN